MSQYTPRAHELPVNEACDAKTNEIRELLKKISQQLVDSEMADYSWSHFNALNDSLSDLRRVRTMPT